MKKVLLSEKIADAGIYLLEKMTLKCEFLPVSMKQL